jgi:hypothetical protein
MDRREAAAVAERVISRLRGLGYQALIDGLLDQAEVEAVVGASGVTYQVEIQARWDSGKPPDLRVIVGVDDGGLRSSFRPVDRTFIITSDGSFIGE